MTQFQTLDLEPVAEDGVCTDYVIVTSTETRVGPGTSHVSLCGELSPADLQNASFTSDNNFMVVTFVSDANTSASGFSAIYYAVLPSGEITGMWCIMYIVYQSCDLLGLLQTYV